MGGGAAVYGLCLLASAVCAMLLIRSWVRTRQKLLLWSAICFSLLAVNNLMVVLDMVILPDLDLSPARQLTSLAAVAVLLYGFVWEADR
jgi:predicted membrane-bound spermidine synthase